MALQQELVEVALPVVCFRRPCPELLPEERYRPTHHPRLMGRGQSSLRLALSSIEVSMRIQLLLLVGFTLLSVPVQAGQGEQITQRAGNPRPTELNINPVGSFSVNQNGKLDSGTKLVFTLKGPPGAQATIVFPNIKSTIPMQEVKTGVYEAQYTVQPKDKFSQNTVVQANLKQENSTSVTKLRLGDKPSGVVFPRS